MKRQVDLNKTREGDRYPYEAAAGYVNIAFARHFWAGIGTADPVRVKALPAGANGVTIWVTKPNPPKDLIPAEAAAGAATELVNKAMSTEDATGACTVSNFSPPLPHRLKAVPDDTK